MASEQTTAIIIARLRYEAGYQRDKGTDLLMTDAADRLDELQAIVEKLPKYADTGEPFVPNVDRAWTLWRGKVAMMVTTDKRYDDARYEDVVMWSTNNRNPFYSSPEAALSAQQQENSDGN